MVRAEEMQRCQVPWHGLGAAIPCRAWKEIWGSAVSHFAPCNFPESTVARLCCGPGWAVYEAGGWDSLGHMVMPSGKGPLQTAEEGCAASMAACFPFQLCPFSQTHALGRVQWCRGTVGSLVGLVVRMMFIHRCGEVFGGASPWQRCA